ncbi:predicted protein [Histoplasma mississippiense (nom. inval.)]|uniref:predicted protein n=1 Tax=Ajellomyces capsulatus (strain NAm1 / WU24) TaxID=2059318 RepID=UPI000157C14F|nr:predicted protein [Histoplasma mississippiense (nom. inval.)]EDN08001.1 predicted protein [Histoplasma mississippiense (nom. inval.)]
MGQFKNARYERRRRLKSERDGKHLENKTNINPEFVAYGRRLWDSVHTNMSAIKELNTYPPFSFSFLHHRRSIQSFYLSTLRPSPVVLLLHQNENLKSSGLSVCQKTRHPLRACDVVYLAILA